MIQLNNELNTLHNNACIKVYDPEHQKLIGVYKSFSKAGQKLGIRATSVQKHCSSKKRVLSPLLNKEVACRLSSIKQEDNELIEKSLKRFLT
jgi:hypothetical protein